MTEPANSFFKMWDEQKAARIVAPPATASSGARSDAARTAYGAATLDALAREVAAVPIHSGRNDALNRAALRGYRLAEAGALDHDDVTRVLGAADGGLDYAATARTLQSAREAAARLGPADLPASATATDDPFGAGRYIGQADGARGVVLPLSGVEDDDASPLWSSWAGVDLGPFIDGTRDVVTPDLLTRTDGVALLYPGLVHSFHGESESGKSLLLQMLAAQLVNDGEPVLFVDFESDPASIVERMLSLGARADAVRDHFRYVQPETRPDASQADRAAWTALLDGRYRLAIVDGVTDALSVFGYGTKENDEITTWMRAVPKAIAARTGAAVAIVDHVTKDSESRGRFAIGGQAKMSGLTGAAYTVSILEPLGRGLRGSIGLRIGKDRPGSIRPHCGPFRKGDRTQDAGHVTVDATSDPTTWTLEPPRDAGQVIREAGDAFRPTWLMEKVSRYVEANPEANSGDIETAVVGKATSVRTAVARLAAEGYVEVSEGPRRAKLYTTARLYRQATDPQSDAFRDPFSEGRTQPSDDLQQVA